MGVNKYDRLAAQLQTMGRIGEAEQPLEYTDEEVRQAVVHARQDIVLLVSYLASLNRQIRAIKYTVVAGVIVLVLRAW
jgi:hypothetical protein